MTAKKCPVKKPRTVNLVRDVPAYVHGTAAKGPQADYNIDGEGSWIYLRRFEPDKALKGRIWNTCCNCGSEHLYTFEVVAQPNGEWWLIKRAYQNPDKPGRKVR